MSVKVQGSPYTDPNLVVNQPWDQKGKSTQKQLPAPQPLPSSNGSTVNGKHPTDNSTTDKTNGQGKEIIGPRSNGKETETFPSVQKQSEINLNLITEDKARAMLTDQAYLVKDSTGKSPLLHLCKAGNQASIVKIFIDDMRKKGISRKDHVDSSGKTCLHLVSESGDLDTLLAILKKTSEKFEPRFKESNRMAARMTAIGGITMDIVGAVKDAKKTMKENSKFIDQKDVHGNTAIRIAVAKGHIYIVIALRLFDTKHETVDLLKFAIDFKRYQIGYFLLRRYNEQQFHHSHLLDKIESENKEEFKKYYDALREEDKKCLFGVQLGERMDTHHELRYLLPYLVEIGVEAHGKLARACQSDVNVAKIYIHRHDMSDDHIAFTERKILPCMAKQDDPKIFDLLYTSAFRSRVIVMAAELLSVATRSLSPNVLGRLINLLKEKDMEIRFYEINGTYYHLSNVKNQKLPSGYSEPWKCGAEKKLNEITDKDGWGLLEVACFLDEKSLDEKTKLVRAVEVIKLLIKEGFVVRPKMLAVLLKNLNSDDSEAQTLVSYLIQLGVPTRQKFENEKDLKTALEYAEEKKLVNITKLLQQAAT